MGWPGPMTYLQMLVWLEWLKSEWNEPDRTDHYLMQIAAYVKASSTGKSVDLNSMRIPFKQKSSEAVGLTRKQILDLAKQRSVARVLSRGGPKLRVVRPGEPYPK